MTSVLGQRNQEGQEGDLEPAPGRLASATDAPMLKHLEPDSPR